MIGWRNFCVALPLLCVAATPAVAQESPFYLGAKLGSVDADFSGFDKAANVGIVLGYDLSKTSVGTLAVEGEFTTTVSDGSISGGGRWDADTIAAYAAYATAGNVYVKAKAGYLNQDVKRNGSGSGPINGEDSGFSYGAGVGWRIDRKSAIEVEYTVMSDDLNFLSVGYVTHF